MMSKKRKRSDDERAVYVILELASLELVKTKKELTLLNGDDHGSVLAKHGRSESRPDIVHQELMACLDSPLSKAGKLRVYVRTRQRVLIEVHPETRIPRTYKRFAGLFAQLLQRKKVKATDGTVLLRIIKNPAPLPAGTATYGFSKAGTRYTPHHFAASLPEGPVAFVFGAMASGSIDKEDNMLDMVSISTYPLSGATAIHRVLGALEAHWGLES
ncbi:hypothetical protein CTAYLR_008105 [Chrysophaeum taylorii]|uniref:Uncharacterized protein n=1 Tax=Chrysophaeum taylorii TaxID=2483200 RepID=A0AAD7XKQ8_9STRA|nr:hypothetical protein CTAYLR_008105 [Chrysophaeum taylorii]